MTDPWSADFDDLRVFSLAMQNKLELSVCLYAEDFISATGCAYKWAALIAIFTEIFFTASK